MRLELEAVGDELLESARASFDVVDPVAGRAVEVVVVLGCNGGEFIAIGPTRDRDAHDHAAFLKTANYAVDRSYSKGWSALGCRCMNLIDGQRSTRRLDRRPDSHRLLCRSLLRHLKCSLRVFRPHEEGSLLAINCHLLLTIECQLIG